MNKIFHFLCALIRSTELSYSDENIDDFFSSVNIDPALRTLLNGDAPVWLSLLRKTDANNKHPLTHMKEGLNWAQTLGDAARNGFKVIYTPINKNTWYDSTMSYYTTLLHKRIIGQTVFDTKIFNGNRYDTHFYAHCTKNMSGSFSIFGVNAADTVLDITAKLPFRSGTQFVEFILTVGVNGQVFLNGAEIIEPTVLTPLARSKLPGKSALLSMPAHSVAFWVFTGASIPECSSTEEISFDIDRPEEKTTSEQLLQELILETVARDEHKLDSENTSDDSDVNSIPRSKQSKANARQRRDTENKIEKHVEYNAIETNVNGASADDVNDGALDEQSRGKRFIGDANFANRLYNDIDDLKRAHLLAPFKNKMGIPSKRMKREINMLKNLFDKFELKKPVFNFQKPSLKLSARGLIPSISTVHDVLSPSVDQYNQEKKIFEPIENPELPTGDVHFEMMEHLAPANEYAASFADGSQVYQPYHATDVSSPVVSSPPLDIYNNGASVSAPVASIPSTYTPYPVAPNNYGELTEVDVKPEVVTAAPVQVVAPAAVAPIATPNIPPANVQPIQIPYVVKDLPPTWQVNLQNMERARQNLRQNLWPMSAVAAAAPATPLATTTTQHTQGNVVVQSYGPAMAIQPVQSGDDVEHVFFESRRRRRRAIDSRMNDEIEERIQNNLAMQPQPPTKNELRFAQDVDQIEFIDKMARLFDELEQRNQNTMQKSGSGLRKILASRRSDSRENDAPKKCKILSMAMEQQCLQSNDESESRPIFKRAAGNIMKRPMGVLKKIVEKVRSKSPFKKLREKRSIDYSSYEFDNENANSIDANTILKELDDEDLRKKYVYVQRYYLHPSTTTSTTTTAPMPTATTTQQTKTTENESDADNTELTVPRVRKILRTVNNQVNNFVNSVLGHVGSLWLLS